MNNWGTSYINGKKKLHSECKTCGSMGKYGGKGLCFICYNKKNGKAYRKGNKKRHAIQSLISYHRRKCLNVKNAPSQKTDQSVIN